MRKLRLVVFLGVLLTLVGSVHYWIWARLVNDVGLPEPWHQVSSLLVIGLGLTFLVPLVGRRAMDPERGRPLLLATYSWMGICFLLLVALAAVEVVHLGVWLLGPALTPETDLFLRRGLAVIVLLGTLTLTIRSLRDALGPFRIPQIPVLLSRLPPELSGFRIVQLSDIHVGPTIGRSFLGRLVEETNALEPDLVAITGDLVDGSVERLGRLVDILGGLEARHGVFFVTGNHEYYSGASAWCEHLEGLGIRVLRNERVSIGSDGVSFDLVGIDDYNAFGDGHGADLAGALEGRDPARELILLAHQPRAITDAVRHGVGLQLSGHTHGGQLWPWHHLVRLQQQVVAGLHRFEATQLYVSRGTGYWGPPMRLGAPAEIAHLELLVADGRKMS